jgi:hypothetical protein
MKNLKVFTVLGLLLAFASATLAYAKGELTQARIDVPGHMAVYVNDHDTLDALATFGFEDTTSPTVDVEQLGLGIEITRYMTEDGEKIEWDRVMYFPHLGGERGYAYYIGMLDFAESSEGSWYRVSVAGEEALLAILAERGISRAELGGSLVHVDAGNEAVLAQAAVQSEQPATAGVAGLAALTAVAGLGAGWFLGKRRS